MTIGSKAWIEGMLDKSTNIDSGFIAVVLWPFYFTSKQHRLKLFKDGGITRHIKIQTEKKLLLHHKKQA